MHYWRKNYFGTLKEVGNKARAVPEWADYAAFCEAYERGFRNDALSILDRFVSSMERASFDERRKFVSWILQEADGRKGRHMLVPHPLYVRLIEPTLLKWALTEPDCYEPHLWLGGYDHLVRAHELSPSNEVVSKKLIVAILSRVGNATHELPALYLGKTSDDLADLRHAEKLLLDLTSESDRSLFAASIAEERSLIEEYLRKSSPFSGSGSLRRLEGRRRQALTIDEIARRISRPGVPD